MFTFFSAEFMTLNDCLQLAYLPSKRNHMLLLYPREILILDLEVNQTVGVIAIERTGVPFLQVSTTYKLYYHKLIMNYIEKNHNFAKVLSLTFSFSIYLKIKNVTLYSLFFCTLDWFDLTLEILLTDLEICTELFKLHG